MSFMFGKDVEVIQVVRTQLTLRGEGVEGDPVRRVTQYWSFDGDLLAEKDEWDLARQQVDQLSSRETGWTHARSGGEGDG